MAYIGQIPNVSTIQDSNGNNVTTLANTGTQTGLATSIVATDFEVSTGNTTSAQLNPNATFNGAIENIYYYQSISILISNDQSGTLIINQYIDAAGTQKTTSWVYTLTAGQGFNRSFSGNGNYFNLSFTNTGTTATTALAIHTAYGVIPVSTSLGNTATAINEINGAPLSLGQTASANSIPVVLASDQSPLQVTVSNPVNTVTVANPVTSVGITGPVTVANPVTSVGITGPVTVANPVNTVAVSNTNLSVTDSILAAAQSTDNPIKVSITGDESGDFAGVNILEQVVSDGTGIAFNTRTLNAPKVDVNNAQIPSDAPPSATLYLGVNVPQMIDTTGYQSVVFQQSAAVAITVTQSNDGVNFTAVLGIQMTATATAYASATAATASAVYAFPVAARYMRFQAATATSLIVYLRQTPFASYASFGLPSVVISSGTVTANTQGGTAVGAAPATNPNLVAGTDYNGLVRRIQTDTNGNSQVVGQLPQGYQVGAYNVTYSGHTSSINPITATLSTVNPVMMGGVDQANTARRIQTDPFGAPLVKGVPSSPAQQSIEELLTQILGTLRVLTHYTYEGQLRDGFRSSADEPDSMLADYLNPASTFSNMTN